MKTDLDKYSFVDSHYCPAFGSIGKVAVKKHFSISRHSVYKVLFSLSSAIFYSNSSESKNQMLNNLNNKGKVVKSHLNKYSDNSLSCTSQCQNDTLVTILSNLYWDLPMDSTALDSIQYRRQRDTTDFGLPLPIDAYKMCVKRFGYPQSPISQDQFIGKWYGYGHLYDPIDVLTFFYDGSYISSTIPMIGLSDNNRPKYGCEIEEYQGKYEYQQNINQITFIDVFPEKDLTRFDYLIYENPRNNNLIVFSIEQDTMKLYDNLGDIKYYYRHKYEYTE